MLSVTTDYVEGTGDPSPYLKRIADAGFSHVHWCHQWNTDFLYSSWEIDQIGKWLTEFGLKLLDIHGSDGAEKRWASPHEYQRQAGVELVRNRIEMTARLAGHATIMHIPGDSGGDPLRRSLDALQPFAKERGVRIAIENGNFDAIRKVFAEYDPDFVGLCYDSGHGNLDGIGLEELDSLKDRLISVHLHDNDGRSDQHNLLFAGTVDWPRLADILAKSSYSKCVSMELSIHHSGIADEMAFLAKGFETGTAFSGMVDERRNGGSRP